MDGFKLPTNVQYTLAEVSGYRHIGHSLMEAALYPDCPQYKVFLLL